MSKLKDKLNHLEKDKVKKRWETIDSHGKLSTRDKLEKLVNLSLKRDKIQKTKEKKEKSVLKEMPADEEDKNKGLIIREFSYPLNSVFGKFKLAEWQTVSPEQLALIFPDEDCEDASPMKLLFFDTETTGLSGGTGTIPFMLGFGFFADGFFRVKIFILNDLYKEDAFLDEVDHFLESQPFSATVTYNGKSFDFPLMETRYILQRKRFPLLKRPHLDFLFPARVIWKNTYDSRKLGYLGDILLGLSRDDDVDASQIPMMYFNYLRSSAFPLIQKVVDHNALDLVGLAALLLLAVKYQENIAFTDDEGEILGTAKLFEKCGDFEKANQLYDILRQSAARQDIITQAVKSLAVLKKKKKLYKEAAELWQMVSDSSDHRVVRELSVYFEHREKNYVKALEYAQKALATIELTNAQRKDFEKRLDRVSKKMKALEKEE